MKIAEALVVKDDSEADKLAKALESSVPYVDELVVVANHEPYKRVKEIVSFYKGKFFYLPWEKDFAKQRNYAFSKASQDSDFIFWMDADDILVGGEHLRPLAELAKSNDVDCVYLSYWYSCRFQGEPSYKNLMDVEIQQMRERLINPRKMVWKKRLHETPVEIPGVKFKHTAWKFDKAERPIALLHTSTHRGEDPEAIKLRTARNREILELELADERKLGPPDPRTILYLMKIYAEETEPQILTDLLLLGEEYLEMSGWDEERATCNILMGRAFSALGDFDQAIQRLHSAIMEFPTIQGYLRLAEAYYGSGQYGKSEHFLNVALGIEETQETSGIHNDLENKIIAADLSFKLMFYIKHNTRKAFLLMQELYKLNPVPENAKTLTEVEKLANLDTTCGHVDKISRFLIKEGQEKAVFGILEALPQSIKSLPFAQNLLHRVGTPKVWGANEICYYANFGNKHFEEWSPKNLERGIGGSETAVINLAREWVKLGFKVTVYGDPGSAVGTYDGVEYLPYFHFNPKDKFNILIQWRSNYLVGSVSAKKFYVDLHDVTHPNDYIGKLDGIDKIFVKSQYHRKLLFSVPDEKISVVSNGI